MGKCLYCGKEITRKDKKCKYCSYECAALYYKANRKYRESPKPRKDTLIKRSKKAKEELKRLELQERRDNINKLIKETGMHYGEVAYYYGKLICVGEIMGYTHQEIQADIDMKRRIKNE